jgi:IS30 family transposase
MARYQGLTLMEREELSRMLATGHSLRAMAQAMQQALSTVSRALMRHRASPLTSRAMLAHQRA